MSLSVIHLSDIHIKNKNDLILKRIDQLKSACTSSLPSNGTVVIVITGDIAFSGKKDQYELAKAMLDEIVNYIVEQKNSEVQVVFVPGNHDCDFDNESSVRKTLVESAKTNIIDYNYYSSVVSVQNEYISFVNSYGINMELTSILASNSIGSLEHLEYIKTHRKPFYTSLKMQCKLDEHLREVDMRANEMYERLIKQFAAREGITEALKAADMMQWVRAMNNIANRASEIVWNEITGGGE